MLIRYEPEDEQKQLWWDINNSLFLDDHPGAQLLRSFIGPLKSRFEMAPCARLVYVGSSIHDWQAAAGVMMQAKELIVCFFYVKPQERHGDAFYRLLEEIQDFGRGYNYRSVSVVSPVEDELLSVHDMFGPPRSTVNHIITIVPVPSPEGRTEEEEPVELVYYTLPRHVFEDELIF